MTISRPFGRQSRRLDDLATIKRSRLTWQPAIGRTDAERNCLSNIRPAGMAYTEAARRLVYLCTQARLRRCTGIMLKDETTLPASGFAAVERKAGA